MALDLSAEIARLRSLSVPSPPSWTTGNGLPRVVAALDVAWGKTRDANGTGGEEEVAVAVAAGFALDGARGGSLGGGRGPSSVHQHQQLCAQPRVVCAAIWRASRAQGIDVLQQQHALAEPAERLCVLKELAKIRLAAAQIDGAEVGCTNLG